MEAIIAKEKIETIRKLLSQESTTLEKFQSVTRLAKRINPKIDEALNKASETLGKIENLSKGEIIELSADLLPEESEKQKKRKKTIVLFIKYYKELRSEIERIKMELERDSGRDSKSVSKQLGTASRIVAFAKGPFGIITITAVIIIAVGGMFLSQKSPTPNSPLTTQSPSPEKVKGIVFNGQKIPLDQLAVRNGPDCDSPHYHALNHTSVRAMDGTIIPDPGSCAYGKTKDTQVVEF